MTKRVTRSMSDLQKKAISNSLKGRSLSPSHRANIAAAMRKYWEGIPQAQATNNADNLDLSHTSLDVKNKKINAE